MLNGLVDGLDIVKEPDTATPGSSLQPEAITHAPWDNLGCVYQAAEKYFHSGLAHHLNTGYGRSGKFGGERVSAAYRPHPFAKPGRLIFAFPRHNVRMLIRKASDLRFSDITPKSVYLRRREFLQTAAGAALGAAASTLVPAFAAKAEAQAQTSAHGAKLANVKKSPLSTTGEDITPFDDITSYNNFYEYGPYKEDPKANAWRLKPRPWTIKVEGFAAKTGTFGFEEFTKPYTLEERVYRMRCVEAWSMVIPWVGIPLKDVINTFQPTSQAKYVEFVTALNPAQMPGQTTRMLPWPYVEGLRMDEAMNPLSILAVGLYEETLPNQDGAPIRLVTPWKYGFKGVKSIVKIKFVERQPLGSWQKQNSAWYGFYSNVNPTVNPVRWNQASERRIGEFFQRKTVMFNGYGDQVASLYTGLDLRKNY